MGYPDALTSGSFKTKEGGGRFFFPWGIFGHGYAVASDDEFERLRRYFKAYQVVSLILVVVAISWKGPLVGGAVLIPLVAWHVLWARSQCRGLPRTDERLTFTQSVAAQARAHSTVGLWLLELGALAFVAAGVLIVLLDRGKWPVAVASILLFGFAAAMFARMLLIKSREREGDRSH